MAEDKNKIYIYVSHELPNNKGGNGTEDGGGNGGGDGDGGGNGGDGASDGKETKKSGKITRYLAMRILENTVVEADQWVNYYASQIGDRTGQYSKQYETQRDISIANKIVIGLGGMAINLAYGNIAYAGLSAFYLVASLSSSIAQSFISNDLQTTKNNMQAQILRERSGLDSATNNNRGTED